MFVLVRRISPYEFGLVGIANIWNNFLTLFLELGFSAILVQRKEITAAHIASGSILNLICGLVLMVASMAAAGPIGFLTGAPEAQAIIGTLSISFVITAAASPRIALAQREFRFRELAVRDFIAQVVAVMVGIVLALKGFGVWAVVGNSLVVNSVFAVLVWMGPSSRICWKEANWDTIREIWGFGSNVFAFTSFKYLFRSVDSILVGMLFGAEKLGLYNFAQRVTAAPTKAIQVGLAAYLFPKASSVQESPTILKDVFLVAFKVLNYFLLNFSALLLTVGTGMIVVVFGPQWEPATHLLGALLFVQFLAPAIVPLAELAKAANVPQLLVGWTVLTTIMTSMGLVGGSRFGFETSVAGFRGTETVLGSSQVELSFTGGSSSGDFRDFGKTGLEPMDCFGQRDRHLDAAIAVGLEGGFGSSKSVGTHA